MVANVETIAWSGSVPWHGLGVRVGDDLTAGGMLIAAGCDWTVSKRPLAFDTGSSAAQIADRFALVRDTDHQFLDIVGKTFKPTQNKDAFDFFEQFVKEAKLKMHTAGSLCGGKYVWALAETAKSFEIGPSKDKLESYILLVSPHQFGKALVAQQTAVRVVCQNTLNLALNEKGVVSYKLPHVREFNAEAKMKAGIILGLVDKSFDKFKEQVESLASNRINRLDVVDFYSKVLGLKKEATIAANDDGLPKSRLLRQFMDAYEGGSPGANLAGTKGTLWGALNGVTYVLDHVSKRDPQKALRDNWFGYRGDLKRKALRIAVNMAA